MALTITELFNDSTTREIGGIAPDQVNLIVSDLIGVQQGLSDAFPQVTDLTSLHAHVIINQLNEEIASVENANSATGTPILGTNLGEFVGRAINDIHRDIIDIAQADPGLQAVFNPTPLPALNTPPAPFHDDATQTAFLTQFIQDSNHLGQAAIAIENNGFNGDSAALIEQIQTFEQNANAFDQSQGGLWSARFWNELRADGTAGTAANALIDGLQTHNADEVNAAAQQLAMNASDLAANNLKADGGSYADVVAAAQATAVTPAAGQASGGGTEPQASGGPQDPAAGSNHDPRPGANGEDAQASAGASQEPGADGSHTSHGAEHGANGHGGAGKLNDLAAANLHGTFTTQGAERGDAHGGAGTFHDLTAGAPDFVPLGHPTHAGGVHDDMHVHLAHMWAG